MEVKVLRIGITKWGEINSKSDDVRHPSWFKVSQDIGSSQALFDLTSAEKWVWILILAARCRARTSTFEVNINWFCGTFNVPLKDLLSAVKKLSDSGIITVHRQSTDSELTEGRQSTDLEEKRREENRREETAPLAGRLHRVALLWNYHVPSLPAVKSWTKARDRAVKARQPGYDDRDPVREKMWCDLFARVEASDFLSGRSGKWTACSFDWVMKPANFVKILEGNYDNRDAIKTPEDWESRASRALASLIKHGTGSHAPAMVEVDLGPELYKLVLKVGTTKIREVQRGEFQIRNIAGMLKAASEGV